MAKKKVVKAQATRKAKAVIKPVRKPAAAKPARRAAPAKKVAPKKVPARKPAPAAKKAPPLPPMRKLPAAELKAIRERLERLRDQVIDGISFLAGDNLNRSPRESSGDLSSYSFHMADQGTDNFDREFALNLVSSGQDALYEITEALARLDSGEYGRCQECGRPIEKQRLKALPFAKMCIQCKSAAEKGRAKYRPFGPTIQQGQGGEG